MSGLARNITILVITACRGLSTITVARVRLHFFVGPGVEGEGEE